MTGAIPEAVIEQLPATPALGLASPIAAIIIGFMVALLLVRLLASVWDRPAAGRVVSVVDIAAVPLLACSAAVVTTRLLEILPLG